MENRRNLLSNVSVDNHKHVRDLANIMLDVDDATEEAQWTRLSQMLGLKTTNVSQLQTQFRNRAVKPFMIFVEILTPWISRKGTRATFGVLLQALEDMEWQNAIDKIVDYNWNELQFLEQNRRREASLFQQMQPNSKNPTAPVNPPDWPSGEPLVVRVKPANQFHSEGYTMGSQRRGNVLIINNYFMGTGRRRDGCHMDEKYMKKLFTQLGFHVQVEPNVDSTDLEEVIKKYQDTITDDMDGLVVIVMSHGSFSKVEMADLEMVNIYKDIINPFQHDRFDKLHGKPKIFIFQSCQQFSQTDSTNLPISDTLVCFSTLPGDLAWRNKRTGSQYIYTLAKVFMENACDQDIETMFNMVAEAMGSMVHMDPAEAQAPALHKLGTFKKLYFNPGF